jgi:hypothetical protein
MIPRHGPIPFGAGPNRCEDVPFRTGERVSESDRPVAVENIDDSCRLDRRDINVFSHARVPASKLICHQVGCVSIAENLRPSLVGREIRC